MFTNNAGILAKPRQPLRLTPRNPSTVPIPGEPNLLGMPVEVKIQIAGHLLPLPLRLTGPSFDWAGELKDHRDSLIKQLAAFLPILLSHSEMYMRVSLNLYGQLHVGKRLIESSSGNISTFSNTSLLLRTLGTDRSLHQHVTTMHAQHLSSTECKDFFRLPHINTISLESFNDKALDLVDYDLSSFSVVKKLYLLDCGADEDALTQLLYWPQALEVLYLQVEQDTWDDDFSCEAIEHCFSSQHSSLRKLVLNRVRGHPPGEGDEDTIDLSTYNSVKSLTIASLFLTGDAQSLSILSSLPPNLVELEVDYDDTYNVDFYNSNVARPLWLFDILASKEEKLPLLQRVRITAYLQADEVTARAGGTPDTLYCRRDTAVRDARWRPPRRLMDAFDAAQVCYSVFLNEKMKHRKGYAGMEDFEEVWEDDWVCSWDEE